MAGASPRPPPARSRQIPSYIGASADRIEGWPELIGGDQDEAGTAAAGGTDDAVLVRCLHRGSPTSEHSMLGELVKALSRRK